MLNKLVLLPSMIFIILLLCSCESFEAQKTFARRILDNPDSAISIYKNSEFYNDSINDKNWIIKLHFSETGLNRLKKICNLKKIKVYNTDYKILDNQNVLFIVYESQVQNIYEFQNNNYYILFTFEKIDGNWCLVTMNYSDTYPFYPFIDLERNLNDLTK